MIGSHLDKEIEDLNQHIDNEKCTKIRKQIRLKRTKIKQYKSKLMITLGESINTTSKNLFFRIEIVILKQIMMPHL